MSVASLLAIVTGNPGYVSDYFSSKKITSATSEALSHTSSTLDEES